MSTRASKPAKEPVNLVVVAGECSAPPELRELESGRRLAEVAVRTRTADGRSTSVPVTVWEPPAWVEDLDDGTAVIVIGAVRRRFFRTTAGASVTRVDVEASFIGRAGRKAQRERAWRRAGAALEPLLESLLG